MPGSNESMATEISNGRLMMNSRNQNRRIKARIVSISNDGGQSWDKTYFDTTLIDPVNQGSILTVGKKNGKAIIAFCNAADPMRRDNLTLRISYDNGLTWSKNILVDKSVGNTGKDFTAYSDIVKISKNKIGVLYERDRYSQIVFTVLKWK
jgi:sialidase-1